MADSFWKGSTALVTGAHGFTGSHLCRELLQQGAKVKAFVKEGGSLANLNDIRKDLAMVTGSVTDMVSLLQALRGVDYVFHPAAIVPVMDARRAPQNAFTVNGIGSFNVAMAARECGVKKMLHVSTCHVYGNLPDSEQPIRETAVPRPGDLYAASKYAAEIYLRPLIDEGYPVVISRSFAFYGPGQGEQFFIPRVITQLLRGEQPKLGSPKPTRDYTYISDIAKGYLLILQHAKPGEIVHLSSEKETSMGEVYETIASILNVKQPPVWNDVVRPQDILRLSGTSARARQEFGWKPAVSFKEGLSKTIDWWRGQFALRDPARLGAGRA